MNRFRTLEMRGTYEALRQAYRDKHRDLFHKNGARNMGSAIATYFWRGFDGINPYPHDREWRTWSVYACWRAGQDAAKDA